MALILNNKVYGNEQNQSVMNYILNIQREAYGILADTDDLYRFWEISLLHQFGSSLEEVKGKARRMYGMYSQILENHNLLTLLPDMELASLRHILWKEEEYLISEENWAEGVNEVWEILLGIEELRKPQTSITYKVWNKFENNG